MRDRARATTVAIMWMAAVASTALMAAEPHRPACLSDGESRETVQSRKMIPPFRAVQEALRGTPGESVGIRLCRLNTQMVYDVAVLRQDGYLVHILVDAVGGALLPARGTP